MTGPTAFMKRADYQRRKRVLGRRLAAKAQSILEISPLDSPLVARNDRKTVKYADIYDMDTLREQYKNSLHDIDSMAPIDYVLGKKLPHEVVDQRFDWIIMSRSLEYRPNFLGWLESLGNLLNEGGKLFCVLPDRRYCFTLDRPYTTVGELVENYHLQRTDPAPRRAFDQSFYHKKVSPKDLWSDYEQGRAAAPRSYDAKRAMKRFRLAAQTDLKVVCNLFDPKTLRDAIETTRLLGYHRWRIDKLIEPLPKTLDIILIMHLDRQSPDNKTLMPQNIPMPGNPDAAMLSPHDEDSQS